MARIAKVVLLFLATQAGVAAAADAGQQALARDLAALLVAGRDVVSAAQERINDPAVGPKGFTVQLFVAAVREELQERTGLDVARLDPRSPRDATLLALLDAEKAVVAQAQPLINQRGLGFKGFTPAVFGRDACERFSHATGVVIRQTSEQYRNPRNQPDAFERAALARFRRPGWERAEPYAQVVDHQGRKVLRYLRPVFITGSCVSCHGASDGEPDATGHVKEGYHAGEVRGAISIILPAGT
jgi:general secretion pathway protein A